jgi:excinuclease ABC subunit A
MQIKQFCDHFDIDVNTPFKDLTKKEVKLLFYGSNEVITFKIKSKSGMEHTSMKAYEGIVNALQRRYETTTSSWSREYYQSYMNEHVCSTCHGTRLRESILHIFVGGININQVTELSIKKAKAFFDELELTERQAAIANLILKEIDARLSFLINVGLDYLNLSRMAGSLSGGEAQRIRLATQIGSRLTGVLYVLDEPSIGLHQRDNHRLIETLKGMRDLGNTLLVVEHDEETMLECDYLIDIGPGAGIHGGEVVSMGTPNEVMKDDASITGQYLSGKKYIPIPKKRRKGNGLFLEVKGAAENNLKKINVKFPLNKFVCVTGVSGSGKSSLVNQILYKSLAQSINRAKDKPGIHKEIIGLEHVDKIVNISQSPIGRTPRSNPATYTGVFDPIRDLFASLPDSKLRGYKKGRFSFNVKGGRCEACSGDGVTKIEMHFLPDVYVPCEVCKGKRYNSETLEVRFKGKNIYEVLEMTVEDALTFFENHPRIKRTVQTLFDVGLGYIKLGQAATTLSGGEAQRVKLAKELQKRATGKTIFILDEPTTGLHVDDVSRLIHVLNRIVDNNDTVIVIEHNLDIIKVADHIIDLGPEGGELGGKIVAQGTPEKVAKAKGSYTGHYLNKVLEKGDN